jgi:hypothetical protein
MEGCALPVACGACVCAAARRAVAPLQRRGREVREAQAILQQRERDCPLHAEARLGVGFRIRVAQVVVAHPVHQHIDAFDIAGIESIFLFQKKQSIDSSVHARAAGMDLGLQPVALDRQRSADRSRPVAGRAGAGEKVPKAPRALQRLGTPATPLAASIAAMTPCCAARPACNGLAMVPNCSLEPLAMLKARLRAAVTPLFSRPISRAQAAAAPKGPSVEVECQPRS